MPRRGWVIRNIKNPESIAEHTFRVTIMAWFLGEKKRNNFNIEKIIKMALIHDLCEVYAGDTTPYDSILTKDKKQMQKLVRTWPRFSEGKKKKLSEKKYKKEKEGLEKLIKDLSPKLKNEVMNLWMDYENGSSKEGRFFKQTDRIESFLQSMEYWEKNKKLPQGSWWEWAREFFDDPVLLDFIEKMDKKFYKKNKPKY
ncbi:MAG: HD domain-containing protein [Candidatus Staskawiczbacteria bacterium]|nr:HD domain-containing protein [Candidatus Staskawiczbacteria bacterium]MBI3337663.1 HD domain-containing protein [Candidatus Staskawiczbacteria bacterium]